MKYQSILVAATGFRAVSATIALDTGSQSSLISVSSQIAKNLLQYYTNAVEGPNTPAYAVGLFPYPPFYWWESGGVWGGMVDYWAYTKDTTWEQDTLNALNAQVGPNYDFIMPQQAFNTGNDDQAFWVFPALSALEYGMPLLPCPEGTSNSGNQICPTHYLNLAVNAFNDYVYRWGLDSSSCGGGLKWQFSSNNAGYNYKNAVSNGAFFQVAARLARYTGNQTYADWAVKVYDWSTTIGLVDTDFSVFDGTDDTMNCSSIDHTSWTYNSGMFMYGCAVMYDYTKGSAVWKTRVSGFVDKASIAFFHLYPNATGIMYEAPCEPISSCTTDQYSFKAYLARWMAKTGVLAPFVKDQITGLLTTTANAIGNTCIPSATGVACGTAWWKPAYDGVTGVGQQLSALEVIQALLIGNGPAPATSNGKVLVVGQASAAASSSSSPSTPTSAPAATRTLIVTTTTAAVVGGGVVVPAQSSSANAAISSGESSATPAAPSPPASSSVAVSSAIALPPVVVSSSTAVIIPPTSSATAAIPPPPIVSSIIPPPSTTPPPPIVAPPSSTTSDIASSALSSTTPPPPVVAPPSSTSSVLSSTTSPPPVAAPPRSTSSDIASSVEPISTIAPAPIVVASSAAAPSSLIQTTTILAISSAAASAVDSSAAGSALPVVVVTSSIITSIVASSDGSISLARTSSAPAASVSSVAIATTVVTTTASTPQAVPAAAATTTRRSAAPSTRFTLANSLSLTSVFMLLFLAL